jgi:hypothetical protein
MDGFDLAIRLQTGLSQFSTNTRLFHTSKGDARVTILGAIDPNHARLNLGGYTVCSLNIARED